MICKRCNERNEYGVSYLVTALCRTRSNKIWICKDCENNENVKHCSNWFGYSDGCRCQECA